MKPSEPERQIGTMENNGFLTSKMAMKWKQCSTRCTVQRRMKRCWKMLNRNTICTHFSVSVPAFRSAFFSFFLNLLQLLIFFPFVNSIEIKATECFKANDDGLFVGCFFFVSRSTFFCFPFNSLPIAFHKQLEVEKKSESEN